MPWSLEAGFALAAVVLTLLLSGLGLFLKHRKEMLCLSNSNATIVEGIVILFIAFADF